MPDDVIALTRANARTWKALAQSVLAVLALLIVARAAQLVFQNDPNNQLRQADALFMSGRYHDAQIAYTAMLRSNLPTSQARVRLGVLATMRNEQPFADQILLSALSPNLSAGEYDLVRLCQGRLAAKAGQGEQAEQYWNLIGEQSQLFGARQVFEGESLLAQGNYAGAEAAFRAALQHTLPASWIQFVHTRLALLRASSDQAAALAELGQANDPTNRPVAGPLAWAAVLLPPGEPSPQQLQAALAAPASLRSQTLGQLYLGAQLYPLAEAQFAAVPPGSAGAQAAAAYAAYTRWLAGDHAEGLRRLNDLVARYPNEPRARALLALAYLSDRNQAAAKAQLESLRSIAPHDPDTLVAWGQWYALQHDYVAAAGAYRSALDSAAAAKRGSYALALARFSLDTSFQICQLGRMAAEEAAGQLPADPRAWNMVAAMRLSCGDDAGAQLAAEQARRLDPANAEASYYLGLALASSGQNQAARASLIQAADLAPASPWRERAEHRLATLAP